MVQNLLLERSDGNFQCDKKKKGVLKDYFYSSIKGEKSHVNLLVLRWIRIGSNEGVIK